MKALKIIIFIFSAVTLLFSCNTNAAGGRQISGRETAGTAIVNLPLLLGEDYDLFTDYYWGVSDGRSIEDPSISTYDWIGDMTPRVIFRKLEIPAGSVMYQERLRNEQFSLVYQTDDATKLYQLEDSFSSNVYEIIIDTEIDPGNTHLILGLNGYLYSGQLRAGGQTNINYPLTGIWGRLPNLTEYRQVDYSGCLYYMEIDKDIPFWAVRSGAYLLRQTGENTFETVTSFPDGSLKLDVISEWQILLRPLFSPPAGEKGLTGLLSLYRSSVKISEIDWDEYLF